MGRWRTSAAGSVHVTVLPQGTSGGFTVLELPLASLIWYRIASANETFVMSLLEKKIQMASKFLILSQVSPPDTHTHRIPPLQVPKRPVQRGHVKLMLFVYYYYRYRVRSADGPVKTLAPELWAEHQFW